MRGAQGKLCDLVKVRRHPEVFTFLSAPADKLIHTLLLVHSIEDNSLTEEAKQTLQDAA